LFNRLNRSLYPSDTEVLVNNGIFTNKRVRRDHLFFIETRYRGYKRFPSPFNFQVTFGKMVGKTELEYNNAYVQYYDNPGINFPYILDEVTYIHVKDISLPLRLLPGYCLNERYLILRINEVSGINVHYSNPVMSPSDILIWRLNDTGPYWYGEGKYPLEFKPTAPLSIKRLTFQVLHTDGSPIQVSSNLNEENPLKWDLCYHKKPLEECKMNPETYNKLVLNANTNNCTDDMKDHHHEIIHFKENYSEFNPYFDLNNGFINLYIGQNDKQDLEV